MADKQVDIVIIGGGLIGAALMLALRNLKFSTLLVENNIFSNKINADFDARSLALSPASQRILEQLKVWETLQEYTTPIEMIHVSDQKNFGMSRLKTKASNPLGYVVEIQYINSALHQLLPKEQMLVPAKVTHLDLNNHLVTVTQGNEITTIKAQLIVAADGAESPMRGLCNLAPVIKNYHQHAIVANIGLLKPHGNRAYERFTMEGPLALLPMTQNKMSLVWTLPPQKAKQLLLLEDQQFLQHLHQAFGYRLGRLVRVGKRFSYPLQQVLMKNQAKWPVVFLGNAAHTLHPVAGQGFNLGLRDVASLAQCIHERGLNPEMIHYYLQLRKHDQSVITQLTDGLIQVFTSRLPGIKLIRNLSLLALDHCNPLKNLLAHYTQGFGGMPSDLVCGLALESLEEE